MLIDLPLEQKSGTLAEQFLRSTSVQGRASIDYQLYVPPGDRDEPRPLLVMLHGCGQDPDDFAAGTRMNEMARRNGWLVLYPAQSAKANPQGCWNWFKTSHQERGRGEPALIATLTQEIMATHRVDANRVYIAGLSAGGAMAVILGRAYPELFAAVGVHSGLPHGAVEDANGAMAMMRSGQPPRRATDEPTKDATVQPTTDAKAEKHAKTVDAVRPTPTIVFHGTRDMTVHPLNGEQVYADATSGVAGAQRVENGREGTRAYTRRTHVTPQGRVHAELWLIEGGGHGWSGGDQSASGTDWLGPDASDQMLCFFMAHPLGDNRA
ncbi:extracellular catalytic domain type 1 short-chain-length polyhydroxyalkanoate depolymerase [Roseateles sp. L2-2]|uniref:extracellular catalytic domain type 1 short-chain-length polyhydroxyalkanoate depolymerase n=1 Tax=Roseateles sp. L2-2 TaxID=3422597 RepID=UPI003D35FD4C